MRLFITAAMASNPASLHHLYAHPQFLELYKKNLMESMDIVAWTYISSHQRKWAARLLAFQDLCAYKICHRSANCNEY
jgi:hypothetical protein